MSDINIPNRVVKGFSVIARLQEDDIEKLISVLNDIELSSSLENVSESFQDFLDKDSADELVKVILSFKGLLNSEESSSEELADRLLISFIELYGDEEPLDVDEQEVLRYNLIKILSNYNKLKIFIKSKELTYSNENILRDFEFITDLRIIRDESDSNNIQGVLIYKMSLTYTNSGDSKDLYLSLDLEDLKKLKTDIEKVITGDREIRESFNNKINIV